MRTLKQLAVAAALAATTFATPAHAVPLAAHLSCDWHLPNSGTNTCTLTGQAAGTQWLLTDVVTDIYGVNPGLCGVNGTLVGHLGAPVNADFNLTWVGPLATVTLAGATTGAGTAVMVLVTGNPCFSPEMSYAVVMELAGV